MRKSKSGTCLRNCYLTASNSFTVKKLQISTELLLIVKNADNRSANKSTSGFNFEPQNKGFV